MTNASLFIIRGLPGAGKSTFANTLKEKGIVDVVLEADQFFTTANGQYYWDRELIDTAHEWCQYQVKINLKAGLKVAVANTFIKRWQLNNYAPLALDLGLKYQIIKCSGAYKDTHNVPDDALERMKEQWQDFKGEIDCSTFLKQNS